MTRRKRRKEMKKKNKKKKEDEGEENQEEKRRKKRRRRRKKKQEVKKKERKEKEVLCYIRFFSHANAKMDINPKRRRVLVKRAILIIIRFISGFYLVGYRKRYQNITKIPPNRKTLLPFMRQGHILHLPLDKAVRVGIGTYSPVVRFRFPIYQLFKNLQESISGHTNVGVDSHTFPSCWFPLELKKRTVFLNTQVLHASTPVSFTTQLLIYQSTQSSLRFQEQRHYS